ncbi:trypsin-like peptidase domain-containing protein [Paenibacillus sp. KQZ6P-2]|uniref:Trypsin-like peptidase domain-containing protein n=1 Tax=Paenibacillus mangrovi TaxID=2931978 RepID=A0A9X1WQV9_9BACL|nr:trypsin-like peptidase domain-containing protein [Paenibacillus mangrovi]MCJ8013016.1 trypsin-like peptidase domain-containing protein [Paenibacillus mangrovi]
MGLFQDDFYSTKVPKRRRGFRKARKEQEVWPSYRRSRGLSTLQIATISSVISAFVAVLLFSMITGLPSYEHKVAAVSAINSKHLDSSGDPYDRLVTAAAKVRPTVVSIVNYKDAKKDKNNLEDSALGSGVIFKKDNGKAFVITNNHVIEGAQELEVVLVSGEMKEAKLVGADKVNDIAVLAVDDKNINEVAEMGDSDKLRLGETVLAIGNPLGLGDTLTSGIVSYTNRVVPVSLNQDGNYDWEQEVIQTDAAINEGNSGGALVDLDGKVIGINTMKIADTGVEGLGFAIPIDQVMKTVDELMAHGKIARPYIGIYSMDLNNSYAPMDDDQLKELKLPSDVKDGVVVLDAIGPAAEAGLKLNDVIVKFNDDPITTTLEMKKFLYDKVKIGDTVKVTFYRDGKEQTTNVKLAEKPDQ